ncbi:hypothetical protein C3729_06080 [Cloacibacterium normanense]|jgi:hypothetical protein|uniref:Lipoprotein n=1 Tax=Cloacibacterium normanense TaxID=237258 RepID=A0A2S7I4Z5_9FLAO|nr:hypothetical protein [Cloacibacterium normanense]MBV2223612.1 hypothetical protein [Cloacibacterium sp.]PPZ91637.1 hypothetical protein C3729_06080 [Cloacibacterium normanense]
MRKIFAYLFLIVLLTSCIANTKMSLSSSYKDEFILNKSKKYLFIKNNLHTNDLSFIKTVDNDFKNIFGENMYVKNSLLEFDNDRFVRVTDGFVDIMKENYSEEFDYLVILRFMRKPENKDDLDNKIIKVKIDDVSKTRVYHTVLQIVDLKQGKIVYSKEAISDYKKNFSTGITTTPLKQLYDTYDHLLKEFRKKIYN